MNSIKLGWLATFVIACSSGPQGPQGPAGPPGANGESVSALVPSSAFLARTVDVEISGYGTSWDSSAAPTVDFGAGITVNKVTVASATGLLVTIQVDKAAALGARDVTVTSGGKSDVFKGAFHIDAPIAITTTGTLAQGSVVQVHVNDQDLSTPFDTTSKGDGLYTPLTYPNLSFTSAPGITPSLSQAARYDLDVTMLIDVTATTGAQTFDLASGPSGQVTEFPLPNAYPIAARTPTAVTLGTPVQGNVATAYDSSLYSVTPTSASLALLDVAVTSSASTASPALALLPKSGKFADLIGYGASHTLVVSSTDPYYAIYWDSTGTTGAFTLTSSWTAALGVTVASTSTTKLTAQIAASLPYVMQNGVLVSGTDQHWVKYTAGSGDVGKRFHVVTYDADALTDTLVDVQNAVGTSLGGPSADTGTHEDFTSSPIAAAGDYYVVVKASPNFDPAHKTFNAWIRLE